MERIILTNRQVIDRLKSKEELKDVYITKVFDWIRINNITFFNSYLEFTEFDVYVQPINSQYFSANMERRIIKSVRFEN